MARISVEDEAYVKNDRGNVCDKVKKDDSYNFIDNRKTEKYEIITWKTDCTLLSYLKIQINVYL